MSMKNFIREKFLQGLDTLRDEIKEVDSVGRLWTTSGEILNPPGTLALHLSGNIQHFIGAMLGKSGYVRQRDNEFNARDLTADQLLAEIAAARHCVVATFVHIHDTTLSTKYPVQFLGNDRTTMEVLFILYGHMQYHLGQINYLKRM
jgi:hypothetical protein